MNACMVNAVSGFNEDEDKKLLRTKEKFQRWGEDGGGGEPLKTQRRLRNMPPGPPAT